MLTIHQCLVLRVELCAPSIVCLHGMHRANLTCLFLKLSHYYTHFDRYTYVISVQVTCRVTRNLDNTERHGVLVPLAL